ncbi:MAG TPA: peptidylprolyl isomerase [Bryobacteraceae bacterium]|nr:peptidylprolyl isomerase [Bryobacteraceae bacterium]
MKSLFLILALGATAFAQTPSGAAHPSASKAPAPHKASTAAPAAVSLLRPSTLRAIAPATFNAKFATTKGDFVVHVTRSWAPKGADRFYNLVKNGFFTDCAFFRYVPNFIVQFGVSPDPRIARAWQTANLTDDPLVHSNTAGTVVFANAGANTRTTQLFINLVDNTRQLDPPQQVGFSPFGQVTSGMDVVQNLYSGYGERPDQTLMTNQGKAYLEKNFPKLDTIKSATIVP